MRKKTANLLLAGVCVLSLLGSMFQPISFPLQAEVSSAEFEYKLVPPEKIYYSPLDREIPYDEYMEKNTTITEYRYYKCEPITWNVLAEENGVLKVIADKILDIGLGDDMPQKYWQTVNPEYKPRITAGSWVNSEFRKEAFSDKENELVGVVYLPNSMEIKDFFELYVAGENIEVTASDYAKVQRAVDNDFSLRDGFWEAGEIKQYCTVDMVGYIQPCEYGVCPMMTIRVGEDYWEYQQQTGGNTETLEWGSYPQTEVTGSALTEEILNAEYDETGYCTVDGIRYKKLGIVGEKDPRVFEHTYNEFWRMLPVSTEDVILSTEIPVPSEAPTPTNEPTQAPDSGNNLTLADANHALKVALGIVKPEATEEFAIDRNCDGKVNLADANLILREALGLMK